MKSYETTLTIEIEKKIKVKAENGDEAMDKIADIFINTDIISLDEDDVKSISIQAESEDESCDDCDGDCDNCDCCSEREFLFEELY